MPTVAAFDRDVAKNPQSQPRDLPIFIAHGTFDPILPLALGELSRDALLSAGFKPDWRSYPMAHAVCSEEIADIRAWLLAVYSDS